MSKVGKSESYDTRTGGAETQEERALKHQQHNERQQEDRADRKKKKREEHRAKPPVGGGFKAQGQQKKQKVTHTEQRTNIKETENEVTAQQRRHNQVLRDLSLDTEIRAKFGFQPHATSDSWADQTEDALEGDKKIVKILRHPGVVPFRLFQSAQTRNWSHGDWKLHVMRLKFTKDGQLMESAVNSVQSLFDLTQPFYVMDEGSPLSFVAFMDKEGYRFVEGKPIPKEKGIEELLNECGRPSEPAPGGSAPQGSPSRGSKSC
jgi:hypothetical protein